MAQEWKTRRPDKGQNTKVVNTSDVRLNRVRKLTHLLDSSVGLPGTSFRLGLDGLLGLIPGVGDVVATLMSSYIVYEAWRLRTPKRTLLRMLGNITIDTAIGTIPIAGDLFDFVWKANRRNLRLLERHLREAESASSIG